MFTLFLSILIACSSNDNGLVSWKDSLNRFNPVKKAPMIHTPEDFQRVIQQTPDEQQFLVIFSLGEHHIANVPLETVVAYSAVVPVEHKAAFFDGVAHGRYWKIDDPAEISNIKRIIPPSYHERIWNGIVMRALMEEGGHYKAMIQRLQPWFTTFPYPYHDGVRVGVQRTFGHNTPKALTIMTEFPNHFHHSILEELGWRSAERDSPNKTIQYVQNRSIEEQCAFIAGAARSRTMNDLHNRQVERLTTYISSLFQQAPSCEQHIRAGIQWGIEISQQPRDITDRFWLHCQTVIPKCQPIQISDTPWHTRFAISPPKK